MYLTGYTSNRLKEIRTIDVNNPFKIGVNGVFNIQTQYIEYELDDVFYKTYFFQNIGGSEPARTKIVKNKSYVTPPELSKPNNVGDKNIKDTIFKVKLTGDNFVTRPLIKEENKLEQVFLPEIKDEIFIERSTSNIYEKHMRLMDINNIGQLETYKNGFFNIKKV